MTAKTLNQMAQIETEARRLAPAFGANCSDALV